MAFKALIHDKRYILFTCWGHGHINEYFWKRTFYRSVLFFQRCAFPTQKRPTLKGDNFKNISTVVIENVAFEKSDLSNLLLHVNRASYFPLLESVFSNLSFLPPWCKEGMKASCIFHMGHPSLIFFIPWSDVCLVMTHSCTAWHSAFMNCSGQSEKWQIFHLKSIISL